MNSWSYVIYIQKYWNKLIWIDAFENGSKLISLKINLNRPVWNLIWINLLLHLATLKVQIIPNMISWCIWQHWPLNFVQQLETLTAQYGAATGNTDREIWRRIWQHCIFSKFLNFDNKIQFWISKNC